jgi:hypothetical protein
MSNFSNNPPVFIDNAPQVPIAPVAAPFHAALVLQLGQGNTNNANDPAPLNNYYIENRNNEINNYTNSGYPAPMLHATFSDYGNASLRNVQNYLVGKSGNHPTIAELREYLEPVVRNYDVRLGNVDWAFFQNVVLQLL